ncbi:hypothetical protein BGZ81_002951 [Podila clonocystis]|nr:hypothetical protein BGZ81_002951 [Podila clonocystis]
MTRNMSRIEVTDLVVKVLEPLKTEDDSSDITLPVTFRVRGELQRLKIIIPNNNKVKYHPVYSVAESIAKKWVPINSKFKVSGVAIYSAYSMNGQLGLASRLEVDSMVAFHDDDEDIVDTSFFTVRKYETNEEKDRHRKQVAREVGTRMSALRKSKKQKYDSNPEDSDSEMGLSGPSEPSTTRSRSHRPSTRSSSNMRSFEHASIGTVKRGSKPFKHSDLIHVESEESSPEEVEDEPLTDSRRTRRETRVSSRASSRAKSSGTYEQGSQHGSESQESREPELSIKEAALDSSSESQSVLANKKHDESIDINEDPEDDSDPERQDTAGGSGGDTSTIDPEGATTGTQKRRPGRPRGSKTQRTTGRKAV